MQGIYKAILKREAIESIEQQRRDMIVASYSNPNWDTKEGSEKRGDYIRDINRHYNEIISRIYDPTGGAKEQAVDWKNPFYAAHRREIERTKELFHWAKEGRTAGEILELEEARKKRRAERDLDQEA